MPRPSKPHILVDLATSVVARGKIIKAAERQEPIPEGWALDKDVGHFIVLVKLDAFIPETEYSERIEKFVTEIKENSIAPGFSSIKLPGEREWESEQTRIQEGIKVNSGLVESFKAIGKELGIIWKEYASRVGDPKGFRLISPRRSSN